MSQTAFKDFLKRKQVNISVQAYLIDALGAMAFTAQGRELGNKLGEAAISNIKKVAAGAAKSAEQSSRAAGDDRHPG